MAEKKTSSSKRRQAKLDRSISIHRVIMIVGGYSAALLAAVFTSPVEGMDGEGLRFTKGPFYKFMLSDFVVFITPLIYVVAVMGLCRYMVDKESMEPFVKKYIQPAYNVLQIAVCYWMCWGLWAKVDIRGGNPFGLNTEHSGEIEFFVFIHYLTKFLDWTDTFMMIVKKKFNQVSFLQVYHHATIGMIWGFVLTRGMGGCTASWGAFINSVTHVIMYSHYLWTSFGFQNPFKRYITSFQLAQFASCVVHALLVIFVDNTIHITLGLLQVAYHCTMLYLFGRRMNWVPIWLTGTVSALDSPKKQE